jgi:hypothetical protein
MRAVKVNNIIRNHEASLSLSRLISHRMCFLVISSHFYHLFSIASPLLKYSKIKKANSKRRLHVVPRRTPGCLQALCRLPYALRYLLVPLYYAQTPKEKTPKHSWLHPETRPKRPILYLSYHPNPHWPRPRLFHPEGPRGGPPVPPVPPVPSRPPGPGAGAPFHPGLF